MAASAKPIGKVPDVNPTVEKSSTPQAEEKVEAKEDKVELEESDLELLAEQKKVPYNRFKEVNEEKKSLQYKLDEIERRHADDTRRAVDDAERRVAARLETDKVGEDDSLLEPWQVEVNRLNRELGKAKEEISTVKGEASTTRLESQMHNLRDRYPEADEVAVLGWKKSQPHRDLTELMEMSHNRSIDRAEVQLRNLLTAKKERAKGALIVGERGIQLKEEDKPKSMRAAKEMVAKWARGG